MTRKYLLLLMLALVMLTGCSTKTHVVGLSGHLAPGKTVTIDNANGDVSAYPPAHGQRSDQYTVEATVPDTSSAALPLQVAKNGSGLSISTHSKLPVKLLVRVPKGDNLVVRITDGSLNVADLDGYAEARSQNGDIRIQMGGYANASTVNGNISATMGSTTWPGSLQFRTQNGDIDVYVPAVVNSHVKAISRRGTVFTDFPVPAHADRTGLMETAEGNIGSGGRGLEIVTDKGNIHLMKLVPQM